jgi:hypothetical protein
MIIDSAARVKERLALFLGLPADRVLDARLDRDQVAAFLGVRPERVEELWKNWTATDGPDRLPYATDKEGRHSRGWQLLIDLEPLRWR